MSTTRKILAALAVILMLTVAISLDLKKRSYDSEILRLQNLVAEKDQTIEIKEGLFVKKAQEYSDLKELLDSSRDREKQLRDEISKNKEKILALTKAAVYWKKAYEGAVNATQEPGEEPSASCKDECLRIRTRVNFSKDFGVIKVTGYTVTNPPEGSVKVEQVRPVVVTIALSQSKDGSWNVRGTTDDENIGIDFKIAAVNPLVLERKWYEDVYVSNQFGISGSGVTDTVGLGMRFGSISVGPTYTYTHDGSSSTFYGGSVSWFPFSK